MRVLSKMNTKKFRVCDRCDFKLDNFEFENTYNFIMKAQEGIIDVNHMKAIEYDKKISNGLDQNLVTTQYMYENKEKRLREKKAADDQLQEIQNLLAEQKKSKYCLNTLMHSKFSLYYLITCLEIQESQEILLRMQISDLMKEIEEYDGKIRKVNPSYDIANDYTKTLLIEESDSESGSDHFKSYSNYGDDDDSDNCYKYEEKKDDLNQTPRSNSESVKQMYREFDYEEDKK